MVENRHLALSGKVVGFAYGKCKTTLGESLKIIASVISNPDSIVKVRIDFDDSYFDLSEGSKEYNTQVESQHHSLDVSWVLTTKNVTSEEIWVNVFAENSRQMQQLGFPIVITHHK